MTSSTTIPAPLSSTELFNLCDDLIEGRIPIEALPSALRHITPGNLRDIAEERALQDRCGFILCTKKPRVVKLDPQATISHRGVLVPRDHYLEFCSGECFDSFLRLLQNLNNLPPPRPVAAKNASQTRTLEVRENPPAVAPQPKPPVPPPPIPPPQPSSTKKPSPSLIKPVMERQTPALKKAMSTTSSPQISSLPIEPRPTQQQLTAALPTNDTVSANDENDEMSEVFALLDLSWQGTMTEEVSPYEVIWDLMTRWITPESRAVFAKLPDISPLPPPPPTTTNTPAAVTVMIDPYEYERKRQVEHQVIVSCAALIKNDDHREHVQLWMKQLCASLDLSRTFPQLSTAHWHVFVFATLRALVDAHVLPDDVVVRDARDLPLASSKISIAQLAELKSVWTSI